MSSAKSLSSPVLSQLAAARPPSGLMGFRYAVGCGVSWWSFCRSGLFDDRPAERSSQVVHGFLEVAVEGHPVPAPLVPHREQFFDIAQRLGGQLSPAGPVVRVVAHGFGLMKDDLLPRFRDLDGRGQVAPGKTPPG